MLRQNPRVGFTQTKPLRRDPRRKSKQQELLKCTGTEQTLALGDCNHHFGLGWDWTGPKEGQTGNGGIDTRAPGRETREKEINSLVLLEPGWSFCRKR